MNSLYQMSGISKQGFHQWLDRVIAVKEEQAYLLRIVEEYRRDHPRMSCRQIYSKLKPETMGRDRFEAFCYDHGYKVEMKKRKYRTTDSQGVIRFPNLLLHLSELRTINQLWVSDITYYELAGEVYYLTFIMDIYNREIIGYSVSDNLRTVSTTLPAIRMAIKKRDLKKDTGLIIHSDGGGQYYYHEFLKVTNDYGIKNSMGKTAYENPFAERINGTIKNDYLIPYQPQNLDELKKMLIKAVNLYNGEKPHSSLYGRSPHDFYEQVTKGLLTKVWVINKKKKVLKKEKVNITIT